MAGRSQPKKLDLDGLWEYALRALGQRAHSSGEIRQKLVRRAALAADISTTMAKLREYGFADDKKYSETFAAARLQNQGFGKFRVFRDLRSKRVSTDVAKSAVDKAFSGTEEVQLIEDFLARRLRGKNLPEFLKEEKNLASVYRRLRTAGFTSGATLSVLKRYANAVEEWNEQEEDEEP